MGNYQQNLQEEEAYLRKTAAFIEKELDREAEILNDRKNKLITSRKDMWENTSHSTSDFTKLTEVNQYLSEIDNQTASYKNLKKHMEKYRSIAGSPYFGRFDFHEDGSESQEKIYVGLYNVIDPKTHAIYVYDWRAPISGIYYNYELGRASYSAPAGCISGDVTLKRQYKIKDSKLEYFFDSSVRISDEMLQEVLSRNSSTKMRNIVETIQKEQNAIIRDNDNELLIVQGVAGSGKTSIALHRIAYLLYEGINSSIRANNIVIISPNAVFSKYISSVLPELGEENVEQITFDDIVLKSIDDRLNTERWDKHIESVIMLRESKEDDVRRNGIEFKGSREFRLVLDRLIAYYEQHMVAFEDVYYDGVIIETRQQMKNVFLNNKINQPMAKRLKRIENMVQEKVYALQKNQLERIQKVVHKHGGHEFDVKSFSRLLSLKKTKALTKRLKRFTEVDYIYLYKLLFQDSKLFRKLARGLILPENIDRIIVDTRENLKRGHSGYEDNAPLIYLRLKIEGSELYPEIRQVLIDEAQDYYPLQYEVFKLLFKDSRYTVLGDINQAIEKNVGNSLYDSIVQILDRKSALKISLNKSYRSSYEINTFTQRLLGGEHDFVSFERHETEPLVISKDNNEQIDEAVSHDIDDCFKQGYESVAVICKNRREAEEVQRRLSNCVNIRLISPIDGEIEKGASVIASYIAKGLEFDVVIIYNANKDNYCNGFDGKLLYVACTRALHRLIIYYSGDRSTFI